MSLYHSEAAEDFAAAEAATLLALREIAEAHQGAPTEEAIADMVADEACRIVLARQGAKVMLADWRSSMRSKLEAQAAKATRQANAEANVPQQAGAEPKPVKPPHRIPANVGRYSYLDWPLPDTGVRLGDANVEQLMAAAAYHERAAVGERKRAGQYGALAAALKDSGARCVREGLTDAEIASIIAGGV